MLVGVTGGMGAGKSSVCSLFASWGGVVVDADRIGHEVLTDGGVIAALRAVFGDAIVDADGGVLRPELGRRAFTNARTWRQLQDIVRPELERRLWERVEAASRVADIVVLDAALLLEWGCETRCDCIVVVDAAEQIRLRRACQRTGLTPAEIRRRTAYQLPAPEKRARADFVVNNDGDRTGLEQAARSVWMQILERRDGNRRRAGRMEIRRQLSMKNDQTGLEYTDRFIDRHIGPDDEDIAAMLESLQVSSLDDLIDVSVPANIRLSGQLELVEPRSEHEMLIEMRAVAQQNQVFRSYMGMGYAGCVLPPVIQRNILENPGWYTQYTPYQAEIAQGRLEALLNFQTMIVDLTGMEIANASLLDEGTAAAEAMTMMASLQRRRGGHRFLVSDQCHPQTIEVVRTRACWRGWEVVVGDVGCLEMDEAVFGVLLQYPASDGAVPVDITGFVQKAHEQGVLVAVAADPLALCLLTPPGEFDADVVVGSTQRFGMPMGYGGPHAAYFATRAAYQRQVPGRIIGVSVDSQGKPALRMALQTREQHIRREKATSNICTAEVLPAVVASMYAVYHGKDGLRRIAERVHRCACALAAGAQRLGMQVVHPGYFDTVRLRHALPEADAVLDRARAARINLRRLGSHDVGITVDESTSVGALEQLLKVLSPTGRIDFAMDELVHAHREPALPPELTRSSPYLTHEVFSSHRSETEMLRYMNRLQQRDLSLATAMIPLGSCTMKLNATVEMLPITWPEFTDLHPFAPPEQAGGYHLMFTELQGMLADITGLPAVSLQPNAGAQGEYTGLMVIRRYHEVCGEAERDVCLIPASAHGTNPASAVMAGLRVVVVECDEEGNVDVADLRDKAVKHADQLAALMVTYPSTHGVFEAAIGDICAIVHEYGGQVYMDGANMNALVGICRPGDLGVDVCHLNLHKTFSIPHGGGGPGMGPIAAADHLRDLMPTHPVMAVGGARGTGPVSAAPWGSALVLLISWAYLKLLGGRGATRATQVAILNANYVAHRLGPYYPVLYKGKSGYVAHEAILDLRHFRDTAGVTVEDVAKRLMDYGFHAPTVSFPVPGTVMVEPTESESKAELDRFCDAMIAIRQEIGEIERGQVNLKDSLLTQAPHTVEMICATDWDRPYTRERAALPAEWLRQSKFWPAVGRVDNASGDRNLICTRVPATTCG